jgi:hypothetical protein
MASKFNNIRKPSPGQRVKFFVGGREQWLRCPMGAAFGESRRQGDDIREKGAKKG